MIEMLFNVTILYWLLSLKELQAPYLRFCSIPDTVMTILTSSADNNKQLKPEYKSEQLANLLAAAQQQQQLQTSSSSGLVISATPVATNTTSTAFSNPVQLTRTNGTSMYQTPFQTTFPGTQALLQQSAINAANGKIKFKKFYFIH